MPTGGRHMKIPGIQLIKKAESKGNEVEVPVAENLGLVDFCKLTYKEMSEDHVMAFAGNLTYKGLFAIFPFFTFLLSLLGLFNATDLVGLGSVFATLWSIVQWPVVALVVLFAFALIYYFAPAAEQRFRWISPGSILAFVFWLIFSLLFSLYASMAGSYNET